MYFVFLLPSYQFFIIISSSHRKGFASWPCFEKNRYVKVWFASFDTFNMLNMLVYVTMFTIAKDQCLWTWGNMSCWIWHPLLVLATFQTIGFLSSIVSKMAQVSWSVKSPWYLPCPPQPTLAKLLTKLCCDLVMY